MNRIANVINNKDFDDQYSYSQILQELEDNHLLTNEHIKAALQMLSKEHNEAPRELILDNYYDNIRAYNISEDKDKSDPATVRYINPDRQRFNDDGTIYVDFDQVERGSHIHKNIVKEIGSPDSYKLLRNYHVKFEDVEEPKRDSDGNMIFLGNTFADQMRNESEYQQAVEANPAKADNINFLRKYVELQVVSRPVMKEGKNGRKYYVFDGEGNTPEEKRNSAVYYQEKYKEERKRLNDSIRSSLETKLFSEFSPYAYYLEQLNKEKISITNLRNQYPDIFKEIVYKLMELYFPKGFSKNYSKKQVTRLMQADPTEIDPESIDLTRIKRPYKEDCLSRDGRERLNPIVIVWLKHHKEFESDLKGKLDQNVEEMRKQLNKFIQYVEAENTKLTQQILKQNGKSGDSIFTDSEQLKSIKDEIDNIDLKIQFSEDADEKAKLSNEKAKLEEYKNKLVTNSDLKSKDIRVFEGWELYRRVWNNIIEHIDQVEREQQESENGIAQINYTFDTLYLELENIYRAEERYPLNLININAPKAGITDKINAHDVRKTISDAETSQEIGETNAETKTAARCKDFTVYGSSFFNKLLFEINKLFI